MNVKEEQDRLDRKFLIKQIADYALLCVSALTWIILIATVIIWLSKHTTGE